MNTYQIAAICAICGAAVAISAAKLVQFLKSKGINVDALEAKANAGIQYAERAADAIAPFLPEPYGTIVKKAATYVADGVDVTEKLKDAGMMSADQRKTAATNLILADLKKAGLPVDSNVEKILSVVIDGSALVLPGHVATANPGNVQATETGAAAAPASADSVQAQVSTDAAATDTTTVATK